MEFIQRVEAMPVLDGIQVTPNSNTMTPMFSITRFSIFPWQHDVYEGRSFWSGKLHVLYLSKYVGSRTGYKSPTERLVSLFYSFCFQSYLPYSYLNHPPAFLFK